MLTQLTIYLLVFSQSRLPRHSTTKCTVDEDDNECELQISSSSDEEDCDTLSDTLMEKGVLEDKSSIIFPPPKVSSAVLELPRPSDPSAAFRLAVRKPDGQRTVWELDRDLQLEVTFFTALNTCTTVCLVVANYAF